MPIGLGYRKMTKVNQKLRETRVLKYIGTDKHDERGLQYSYEIELKLDGSYAIIAKIKHRVYYVGKYHGGEPGYQPFLENEECVAFNMPPSRTQYYFDKNNIKVDVKSFETDICKRAVENYNDKVNGAKERAYRDDFKERVTSFAKEFEALKKKYGVKVVCELCQEDYDSYSTDFKIMDANPSSYSYVELYDYELEKLGIKDLIEMDEK